DGTEEGTVLVADINPDRGSSLPHSFTGVNGLVFFAANDGAHGDELWVLNPEDGGGAGSARAAARFPRAAAEFLGSWRPVAFDYPPLPGVQVPARGQPERDGDDAAAGRRRLDVLFQLAGAEGNPLAFSSVGRRLGKIAAGSDSL